ncbi:hypothetical protein R5H32_11625 [Defluviimonas sp. D31]|uniref:hypothetical protein n=1 Tax=Defluviimonas sp. D31 TaxID=3083253 RepID=UPI00296F48CE|nr:hypothetical protein [Defluviimonas sp. D31]MDW4550001.1 hypothetical protein [Defluviimonas sp. D31]
MTLYRIIDRIALVLALFSFCLFFVMQELETAISMLALWPLTRAAVLVVDVFFTFFTERPLIRVVGSSDDRLRD